MAPAELPKNLERFCQLVLEDAQLHQQLRQPLAQDEFIALAVRLGWERGYDFTPEDVQAALNERRRAWLERWI